MEVNLPLSLVAGSGKFLLSQVLPCSLLHVCRVSLSLHGKLSERPDSIGFSLSRPGTQRSAQFSYILTYKATEMQGSAAVLGTTVGRQECAVHRRGLLPVFRAFKESPETVSWVGK